MENWSVLAALVIAFLGVVVGLFNINPVRAQALRWWRRAGWGWRRRVGRRERRAAEISMHRAASSKRLERTVFRWFREDPQTWWSYVKGISDRHKSPAVRRAAEELLWRRQPVDALREGERLRKGGHVVEIIHRGPHYVEIRTAPDRRTTWQGEGAMTEVANGWCDRGPDCGDCRRD